MPPCSHLNIDMDKGYQESLKTCNISKDVQYISGLINFYKEKSLPEKPIVIIHQDDIICVRDDEGLEMLPVNQRSVPSIELFEDKIKQYPNTQFILIHNVLNYRSELDNLKTVSWQNNWCNYNLDQYIPVLPKTFDKPYHWITLNNNVRVHRHLSCMYALGKNLDKTGYIKFDPTEIFDNDNWNSYLDYWQYNERHEIFSVQDKFNTFDLGYRKIKNNTGYVTKNYTDIPIGSNHENFNKNLGALYKDTAVELINETHWHPNQGGIISEKYFNSVFGCNFPVLVSTANSLQCIRNSGFDTFDDVIDNSYDTIQDPFERLTVAIDNNIQLFENRNYAIDAWYDCKDRFVNNIEQTLLNEKNKYQEFCLLVQKALEEL